MKKLRSHWDHWQDAAIGLLGAWFAVSPWVLDLQHDTAILATIVAMGLALVLLAIGSFVAPRAWEHWAQAAIGAGAAASPWLLGYAEDTLAWRNAVAVGLPSALLALWVMVRRGEVGKGVLSGTEGMAH
jgi:hypothetical protein